MKLKSALLSKIKIFIDTFLEFRRKFPSSVCSFRFLQFFDFSRCVFQFDTESSGDG